MRSAFTGSFARTASSEGGAGGAGGAGAGAGGDICPASSLRWLGVRLSTRCVCSQVMLLLAGLTVSKVRCHSDWLTEAPRRTSSALTGSCEIMSLIEGGFGISCTGIIFSAICLRSISASRSIYADSQVVPAGAIFPISCSRSRAASPPANHPAASTHRNVRSTLCGHIFKEAHRGTTATVFALSEREPRRLCSLS
eukprot:1195830-Prorocentrum_minimum.AAC.5